MSKRFIFQQQQGDRKKAKLDVTISDHNFPLSQNGPNKEPESSSWCDDNDDEILLLASQACEDVYNDVSTLPDYSICMQPSSTSTQLFDPGPSTSKTEFTFKKPTSMPSSITSTSLKDKCNRISSPLPGISSKVLPKTTENINVSDDLIFNDKIYKGQDSDQVYRQLLQLQEENAKLKSENGKLLEKCVTKEGEASILRTQLKSCQMAVDNARMDKIKIQEKVQMEWTEKLSTANGQMHDLKNQLDFKNLEIISIRERFKMLESNKVKLTQVTVPNNDNNISHRNNTTISNDFSSTRKVRMTNSSVQTEGKAQFLKLTTICRSEPSKLTPMLPLILEPTIDQHSLLECNEKLLKHTDLTQNKCRIFSTFHRVPNTPYCKEVKAEISMNVLYEDLTKMAAENCDLKAVDNLLSSIKTVLTEVISQLELISQKMNTAFLKEMDEKYIEATGKYTIVDEEDLLKGRALYDEEQVILARRMVAVLCIVQRCTKVNSIQSFDDKLTQLLEVFEKISRLLDVTSCAILYSGLLLAITRLLNELNGKHLAKAIDIIKYMIRSRPMPFVSCELLPVLRKLSSEKDFLMKFCPQSSLGNLKLDYDQGVLLYKKDSCYFQVLIKQVEVALKYIEKQCLVLQMVDITGQLLILYSNVPEWSPVSNHDGTLRCDCHIVLLQIIVYALSICAVFLHNNSSNFADTFRSSLTSLCRNGVKVIYRCVLRDAELSSQLSHNEGHLQLFCEIVKGIETSECYVNMLSEISGTFQSPIEDSASSFNEEPWMKSFENFSVTD